jgi:pyruvate dehydrogenase E2 component (dihydrolipoamide acetyltransferase)
MATPVLMPRQGNTVESCLILAWKKQKGDPVESGEIICEVETDKAVFEVPSPDGGTLLERFFEEGEDVPVLTTIAVVGEAGESVEEFRPSGGVESASAAAEPAAAPPTAAPSRPQAAPAEPAQTTAAAGAPVGVSPRARRLAGQHGVDPLGLAGSGPRGRVIERDVRAALEGRQPLTPAALQISAGAAPAQGTGIGGRVTAADIGRVVPAAPRETVDIPLRGMRKLIADRMLSSLQTTAQLTLNNVADARALLALRKRLKGSPESLGLQGITVNDLLLYAVARILRDYPELNATLENETIRQHPVINLGCAVDTPRGLMVPVIRAAETRGLRDLSAEIGRMAGECQEGHINPDELTGGTFTVTNLGVLGVRTFTPVLNAPEVAILGVGGLSLEPRRDETGQVEFVDTLSLSLTIDHRAVDGAPAARFLQALVEAIGNIDLVVLE